MNGKNVKVGKTYYTYSPSRNYLIFPVEVVSVNYDPDRYLDSSVVLYDKEEHCILNSNLFETKKEVVIKILHILDDIIKDTEIYLKRIKQRRNNLRSKDFQECFIGEVLDECTDR